VKLTNVVISNALEYLPALMDLEAPLFNFELAPYFTHLSCRGVPIEDRTRVTGQLTEAFLWCKGRFPLCFRDSSGARRPSITKFIVGYSVHKDELLSASSAQAPGSVLMAAQWPLKSIYRLASLIAHESMHQALYQRERVASPVRNASLGYSPWKNTVRPGRLVWHSFWTFACQFALLAESLCVERELLISDPALTNFLADMRARIFLCSNSLKDSAIVTDNEMRGCDEALLVLQNLCRDLHGFPGYSEAAALAEDKVFREYEEWAYAILESSSSKQSTA
jgi:hypothetical protein